jgi:hypothetical protein
MRIVLVLCLLVGCKKDHQDAPAAPAPEPVAVAPAPAPTADPAILDRVTQETLEYTYQMVPLLASFDGDCAAQIERMKKLEPLVQKIRDDNALAGPDVDVTIKSYMRAHRDEVVAKMNAAIAATHLTKDQLEQKDAAIKTKCGTDPAYNEEMNRIGVLRKKS